MRLLSYRSDVIQNRGATTVGYQFSLVLSREITGDESEILREAGCLSAVFAADSLPTDAAATVTKMDIDDAVSRSLAEAIESALEAVKRVPDLSVPSLTVPAQPAVRQSEDESAGAAAETAEPVSVLVGGQTDLVGAAFGSD
jgi:hypothetical protein